MEDLILFLSFKEKEVSNKHKEDSNKHNINILINTTSEILITWLSSLPNVNIFTIKMRNY